MSGILSTLAFKPFPTAIIITPPRAIGTIIPNVVVSERGVDVLAITEHPVEMGASITDHAFKQPAQLTIVAGWSNSAPGSDGSETYVRDIYETLLKLQASRQPVTITTGKRVYASMLIAEIETETNEGTEYSLPVTFHCKQVIIVSTSATALPAQNQQASPQQTAQTQNTGVKQPVPTSLLFQLGGFFSSPVTGS